MPLAIVTRLPGRVGARLMAMFIPQNIISSSERSVLTCCRQLSLLIE